MPGRRCNHATLPLAELWGVPVLMFRQKCDNRFVHKVFVYKLFNAFLSLNGAIISLQERKYSVVVGFTISTQSFTCCAARSG